MKNVKKALLLVLCAILLVVSAVMGTLAYLTDKEAVVNTFTVGQIDIYLDEKDVDNSKTDVDSNSAAGRDRGNAYHLLPGGTYEKDPTVHVVANSENAWLFVKVENAIALIEAATETVEGGYKTIHDQILANGWTKMTGVDEVDNVYYRSHTKNAAVQDYVVFRNFKIAGDKVVNGLADPNKNEVSIDGYATEANEGNTITVTAYAIQKTGFEPTIAEDATEDAKAAANLAAAKSAWIALQNQLTPANPNP